MPLPWKPRWKPVSVLTGFLGSGKTTILQHLLAQPDMSRTALIINEFGEVSVDHLLVETAEEKMVLLSNGCVCCSVRGDLVQAVQALFTRQQNDEIPPFDRILLETTGLADPAPIVQSLIGPALAHYPVYFDTIATTIDASNVLEAIPEHAQMRTQIAVADSLLVTKEDMVSEQRMLDVISRTRELNDRGTLVRTTHGEIASNLVFGHRLLDPTASPKEMRETVANTLAKRSGPASLASTNSHNDGIQSFVITREHALEFGTLQRFLRALCSYQSNDLLRVKGLVKLRGSEKSPYVVHGVQSVMHPPAKLRRWPTKDHRTRLVFITRNISRVDIENMLHGVDSGFG
ncbi:MAG: GTP-binding protein [Myxococcales bacterium]|nr:GTP-binding protein [Myxococcales bacterium]